MFVPRRAVPALLALCISIWPGSAPALEVMSTDPPALSMAPVTTAVSVVFDEPVDPGTLNSSSFRVFGRWSGSAAGTFELSGDQRTVTFEPERSFSAGEPVLVHLSHDLQSQSRSPLRMAGYAFQFLTRTGAGMLDFRELDSMSNNEGEQTRIYGAAASDLNGDGFLDLATVNEVSADVRVFLNLADGTGRFGDYLTPQPIGVEASPNEPADFDNDGNTDLCVAASSDGEVWVLLGNGDGTFSSAESVEVGTQPHGIVPIDVDGDADPDIVVAVRGDDRLALLLNDGSGKFAEPTFFNAGVSGEYGLAAADMDGDGITDLVVAGNAGEEILTLLGNGDGTFTAAGEPQDSGGATWVVALGDLNGDGKLDATTANSNSNTGAALMGQGNGRFGEPAEQNIGAHTVSTDLGDLDGDGDLDWVISSFGGGFWRIFLNDGSGSFSFFQEITAPSNPSCAVLLDFDNDGDLDMALTDEIADLVVLMENFGSPPTVTPTVTPTPGGPTATPTQTPLPVPLPAPPPGRLVLILALSVLLLSALRSGRSRS